jgi:arsenite methyltransferase
MTLQAIAIKKRYGSLAESCCSLSCGGALAFGDPRPGETCVDLGSGRGNDVIRMAELVGPEGRAYGIDISEGMVEKARKNLEKFEISNAEIIQSGIEKLPLPSDSADLVISNCTINHAADKDAVWSEIHRILKVGGRFVVSDIYALETVPEEYRNDPEAVAECWAGSVRREEYLEQLRRAGFEEVTPLSESAPYSKGKIEVASWTIRGAKAPRVSRG